LCQLAYQFGHELGHVLDNSWDSDSKPRSPCQWLEEDLAEAFSLRGLGKLADSWEQQPVFNDAPYAYAIRQYRRNVIENYEKIASTQTGNSGVAAWFRQYRSELENQIGFPGPGSAAIPSMLHELEADPRSVDDIGALNRWPEKTGVPIEQYMGLWERSCRKLEQRAGSQSGSSICSTYPVRGHEDVWVSIGRNRAREAVRRAFVVLSRDKITAQGIWQRT